MPCSLENTALLTKLSAANANMAQLCFVAQRSSLSFNWASFITIANCPNPLKMELNPLSHCNWIAAKKKQALWPAYKTFSTNHPTVVEEEGERPFNQQPLGWSWKVGQFHDLPQVWKTNTKANNQTLGCLHKKTKGQTPFDEQFKTCSGPHLNWSFKTQHNVHHEDGLHVYHMSTSTQCAKTHKCTTRWAGGTNEKAKHLLMSSLRHAQVHNWKRSWLKQQQLAKERMACTSMWCTPWHV